jgi:hypothetical protein
MSTTTEKYLSAIKNMNEDMQSYMILALIFVILAIFIGYMIYLSQLEGKEVNFMNNLYSSLDGFIKPISGNDNDLSYSLYDYYIKTAYNACSGGSYKNDFVDIGILKAIIKQGVRCLDFEVYSLNNQAVVATSTTDDYFVKETFNSVDFASVMDTIKNYAFSGGTCPNPTDPLIIHLRIKSNNQEMYSNLANLFKSYDKLMLGKDFSYENSGQNLVITPLLKFQNKIILIVDKINNSFLENPDFLEYVNLTSNSIFMRSYSFYQIKNDPVDDLAVYNQRNMTIVFPDAGTDPVNPSGLLCRGYGCQMVAMKYQTVDNNLIENTKYFDGAGYAFSLKPADLRYQPVTIPEPTPQNPAYSYATRNASTDYYSFKF